MSRLRDHYEFNPNLHNGDFEHAGGFMMECAKVLNELISTLLWQQCKKEPPRSLGHKIRALERLKILSPDELCCLKEVVRLRNAFAHGAETLVNGRMGLSYKGETTELSHQVMVAVLEKHQRVSNKLLELVSQLSYSSFY